MRGTGPEHRVALADLLPNAPSAERPRARQVETELIGDATCLHFNWNVVRKKVGFLFLQRCAQLTFRCSLSLANMFLASFDRELVRDPYRNLRCAGRAEHCA